MNDNPANDVIDDAAPLDEEFVAYLDGELDAESCRRIEALLASDPAVRRRLQSLERTWDLLDELDAAPLGEPFTQTTLEMVAVAARQEVEQSRAEAPRRRRRWLLAVGAGLLAAAAAGFLAVALHDPDRQLLQDLPLLENLDEYRQIGSIEFLHRLRDEKLPSRSGGRSAGDGRGEHRLAAAASRKHEPRRRKSNCFTPRTGSPASPAAEQQRLRRLYEDVRNDPDAERLRAIMHAYHEWLKLLPALTWAELAEGETDERIALVKKRLQEEQRREGGWRPDAKDMAALRSWMDDCATRHEADFVKSLPTDQGSQAVFRAGQGVPAPNGARILAVAMATSHPGKLPPMMTTEDLARLRREAESRGREAAGRKTPLQQWRVVAAWLRQSFRRAFEERRLHGPLSQNDDERLAEFFEKDLSDEQRDRLLAMPGEEMQWALQRLFLLRSRPPQAPAGATAARAIPNGQAPPGPAPARGFLRPTNE